MAKLIMVRHDSDVDSQEEMTMSTSVLRKLGLALMIALMLGGVVACDDQGPAEEAGENVDNAMEDAGESMEEMGEDVQSSAEEAQN